MNQLREWLGDRENLHRVLMWVWVTITGLAVIFNWISLVKFVSFISLYANIATHWAGKDAAHAAKEAVEAVTEES